MPSARQRLYLAYGSNLHPRRLEARIGSTRLVGVVRLPGWSLSFDKRGGDGSAKANLHAAPGTEAVAYAAAYDLTIDQLAMLDVFEGCGRGYETFPMTVGIDSERVQAFTYLVPSQWVSGTMLPFDWYVDLIVSGARFHDFAPAYIDQIARQAAREDPDPGRARAELSGMDLPLHAHYRE